MIEKLLPRVLNSSSDNRLKKKTEMNDAFNVVVTEDFEDFDGSTSTGNEGVLKPVKGNTAQSGDDTLTSAGRVLGSVSDARTGVIYFFVFSETANEQGVYAYDTANYFGGGSYVYRRIYATEEFNFQQDSVVQGDIVHVSGEGGEFRPVLYFTDNVNEPRKLDVLRCMSEGNTPSEFGYTDASGPIANKDLITACPKAPMHPITFEFLGDGSSDRASDFRRVPGLQFAFQCVYYSGEESALSTYSDIAVPPEYLRSALFADQIALSNRCVLRVPTLVEGVRNFTREVESIRLLVRQGNTGAFFVIDEVPYNEVGGNDVVYNFYNDRVLTGITTEEEQKQFDSLPRVAQAVAVVENRLFYGNYIEGYDEPNVQAVVTANYIDRPNDFVDVDVKITPVMVPLEVSGVTLIPGSLVQRVAGYVIDTTEIANEIPANTYVTVSIVINPGRSIELYNSDDSYHASRIVGEKDVDTGLSTNALVSRTFNPTDYPPGNFTTSGLGADALYKYEGPGLAVFGRNVGVGTTNLRWRCTESYVNAGLSPYEVSTDVTVGSSPASALKLPGKEIKFSCQLFIPAAISNGQQAVNDAICAALAPGAAAVMPEGIELVFSDNNPFIEWDHGFLDPTEYLPDNDPENADHRNLTNLSLDGPFARAKEVAILPKDGGLDMARLITPVCENVSEAVSGSAGFDGAFPSPRGYFIINDATAQFKLRHQKHIFEGEPGRNVLTLEVSDLAIAERGVRTCIPIVSHVDFTLRGWRVYSAEYLDTHFLLDVVVTGQSPQHPLDVDNYIFTNFTPEANVNLMPSNGTRAGVIGYLHSDDGGEVPLQSEDLYVTNESQRAEAIALGIEDEQLLNTKGFSLIDGESGMMVKEKSRTIEFSPLDEILGVMTFGAATTEIGCYGFLQMFAGIAGRQDLGSPGSLPKRSLYDLNTEMWVQYLPVEFTGELDNNAFASHTLEGIDSYSIDLQDTELKQELEIDFDAYIDQGELSGEFRSFKTHANHDFGIVYYDERGRAGNVNRLNSVYVKGYSEAERQASKGRVEIEIQLLTAPPEWGHTYQIVYAGNSTVRDFIQYSVGGAFKAENAEGAGDTPSRNIYVSLNYLQENNLVSYSKSFGAVAPDGTQNLYVFSPGDYLRIISHYTDSETVVYPRNRIFEISDVVNLGSDVDENPLHTSGEVPPHLQGQFLVLKDNDSVNGFTFSDVAAAGNNLDTIYHRWNNRCVVEIVSPRSAVDPEERVYHEIGEVYNIGRNNDGVFHQSQTVTISKGDVWWRRVPVNMADYNADEGLFENLIREEDGELIEPNFRNYYLESKTFNDTFPGTDVNHFGKRKFVSTLSNEVRRFSSVTYSDRNDYSTKRLRYTSFNAYNAPYKDLPNEHGNINTLLNFSDSLFVIQENKASAVPVSRTILSDALGQDTLIGSNQILGTQTFYAGRYGSDNNPESVIKVDNNIYFAHKSKGEVYRFNPSNGVQVISQKGMNAFFRDAFQDVIEATQVRIVSGYDPLKDEYLITIATFDNLAQPAVNQYTQPNVSDPTEGITGDDGGVTTGGFTDPINELIDGMVTDGAGPVASTQGLVEALEALSGHPDFTSSDYYESVATELGDVGIQVDISGLISAVTDTLEEATLLSSAIGTFPVAYQGSNGGLIGQYVPATKTIVTGANISNANGELIPATIESVSTALASSAGSDLFEYSFDSTYPLFVNSNGSLDPMSLGSAVTLRTFELQDVGLSAILDIKDIEQSVVDNVNTEISKDIEDLNEQVISINSPSATGAFSAVVDAYDLLTNHIDVILQGNWEEGEFETVEFISDIPDRQYRGFRAFEINEYPLDSANVALLSELQTKLTDLASLVTGLQAFDGIDITPFIEALSADNAALRGQIDVLTSQIQNLSAAPLQIPAATDDDGVPFPGVPAFEPLLGGVLPGQLTGQTIDILAGADGVLTSTDVITAFTDFNTSTNAILVALSEMGVEITPDVVRTVIAGYANEISSVNLTTGAGSAVAPVTAGDDGAFTNESLLQLTQVATRNRPDPNADVNNDGLVSVNDVLILLGAFGSVVSDDATFDFPDDSDNVDTIINSIASNYGQ